MLSVYHLKYKTDLTVGTHSGYCSGAECEDVDKELYECNEIVISKKNSRVFKYLIHYLPLKRLQELLDLSQYFHIDKNENFSFDSLCHGSGYCSSSPSGLWHSYSVKKFTIK